MDARTRLEANLVSESEAYGYTLSIRGAGALLVHVFGIHGVGRTQAYVAGGLAGFGALALVAFQGFTAKASVTESPPSLVVSTVHIVATGGTLGAVHLLLVLAGDSRPLVVFFAVGVLATVAYNPFLLLDELLVQRVA